MNQPSQELRILLERDLSADDADYAEKRKGEYAEKKEGITWQLETRNHHPQTGQFTVPLLVP
jgi:hypothetical protein